MIPEKLQKMPRQSEGDVIDRMSILAMKVYEGEEEAYEELNYLRNCLNKVDGGAGDLLLAAIRLGQMNQRIWNLENEIRKGGEQKFEREEIGGRAIDIRNYNRKRVRYKNEINEITGAGFREFKIKHRSQ